MAGLSPLRFDSSKLPEVLVASAMRPGAKPSDVYDVCRHAAENGIRNVCIPTAYLEELDYFLKSTGLKASTMISFPTGLFPLDVKMVEIRLASGLEEVYFYPNIGNYLDNRIIDFEWELSRIMEESNLIGLKQVNPILEVEMLSEKHLAEILSIFKASGFRIVMLSFGFGLRRIAERELEFLKTIPRDMEIVVNCRIGSVKDALSLLENRVGRICTIDYEVPFERVAGH
jgi:deoxyribose-phosphate aldolase